MKDTKPKKKLYVVVEILMFAVYILIGFLLFTTGRHCVADTIIFWAGLAVAVVCAVLLIIHE